MGKTGEPTERDCFWLEHEAVLAKSELTAKAYAAEQGLSMHALYQARKRLRAMGWLAAAAGPRRRKVSRKAVAFSKVDLRGQVRPAEFRLSLPNGFVLEWSGSELPTAVVGLVERLTSSR
ncbi:MAG: hypothetical protein GY937_12270 [bacterium]|nr:hypothetical protein [bacterium]